MLGVCDCEGVPVCDRDCDCVWLGVTDCERVPDCELVCVWLALCVWLGVCV
jgi:hypothetical protein